MILSSDPAAAHAQFRQLLSQRSCLVTIVGQREPLYREAVAQAEGDGTRRACMAPNPSAILELANGHGGFQGRASDLIWSHSVHDHKLVYVVRAGQQAGSDRFEIDSAFVAAGVAPAERVDVP